MSKQPYVYVIFRSDGTPCYVGKGRGDRLRKHIRRSHNPHLKAIYAKAGYELPAVIIRYCASEADATETEIALIAAIGREIVGGPLVNMTDGGEGTSGAKMSLAWRKNRSEKAKELWLSAEFRAIRTASLIGNDRSKKPHTLTEVWRKELIEKMTGNTNTLGLKHTDAARAKMSVARKGKPKSAEHRAKIGAANKGKSFSEERCKAISVALKGRKLSDNQRRNIGLAGKGRKDTDETRAKKKAAMARRGPPKPLSAEARAKISVSSSRPRKPLSEEHKAKLSALARERAAKND